MCQSFVTDFKEGINFGEGRSDNPPEEPTPEDLPPVATTEAGSVSAITRRWWPLLLAGALAVLVLVIVLVRQSAGKVRIDPRLAELQRRNDDLVRLAMSLGVTVTPATTISELANALERRTGVVLDRHLDAHLAARYGNGPMPEPWPMDALRQGARTKPTAVKV